MCERHMSEKLWTRTLTEARKETEKQRLTEGRLIP